MFTYIVTLETAHFQSEVHTIILEQSRDLPDFTYEAKGKQMTEACERSITFVLLMPVYKSQG